MSFRRKPYGTPNYFYNLLHFMVKKKCPTPQKLFHFLLFFYFHDIIIIIVSAQNCKSLVKIYYVIKYNNNKWVPCGFPDDSTLSSLNRFRCKSFTTQSSKLTYNKYSFYANVQGHKN